MSEQALKGKQGIARWVEALTNKEFLQCREDLMCDIYNEDEEIIGQSHCCLHVLSICIEPSATERETTLEDHNEKLLISRALLEEYDIQLNDLEQSFFVYLNDSMCWDFERIGELVRKLMIDGTTIEEMAAIIDPDNLMTQEEYGWRTLYVKDGCLYGRQGNASADLLKCSTFFGHEVTWRPGTGHRMHVSVVWGADRKWQLVGTEDTWPTLMACVKDLQDQYVVGAINHLNLDGTETLAMAARSSVSVHSVVGVSSALETLGIVEVAPDEVS